MDTYAYPHLDGKWDSGQGGASRVVPKYKQKTVNEEGPSNFELTMEPLRLKIVAASLNISPMIFSARRTPCIWERDRCESWKRAISRGAP